MGPIWSYIEHVSNLTFTEIELFFPNVVIMSMLCQWLKSKNRDFIIFRWPIRPMHFLSVDRLGNNVYHEHHQFLKDITPMVLMNRLIYFEAAKTYSDRQHPVRSSVCNETTRIRSTKFMRRECVEKLNLSIWTCLRKRKQLNMFLLLLLWH